MKGKLCFIKRKSKDLVSSGRGFCEKNVSIFVDENNMDYAMVTSMTQLGVKKLGERRLQFIPTACYAYTVAENTLRQAKYSYGL